MNFISVMFLAGIAAVAAPIFIHMIRRAPRDNFQFSTLRFLSPSPEVVATRSKIQHWLLLLLRALVIIFIALAFARPYFVVEEEGSEAANKACVLFLVDISASMQKTEIQKTLKEKFYERVKLLKEGDQAALMVLSNGSRQTASFENWKEWPLEKKNDMMQAAFDSIKTDWGQSDLSEGLIQSAGYLDSFLDESGMTAGDIELFTDGLEGDGIESLKRFEWPQRIKLISHIIGDEDDNASLHFISYSEERKELKMRVTNVSSAAPRELKVESKLNGRTFYESKVNLDPGKSRVINVTLNKLPQDVNALKFELIGDKNLFDNIVHVALPVRKKRAALYLGSGQKKENSSYFYLRRFYPVDDKFVDLQVENLKVLNEKELPAFIIIDRPLNEGEAEPLKDYLRKGGTVVMLVNGTADKNSLESMTSETVEISEKKADDYLMWSHTDYRHWLFKPFSEARFKDFSSIFFWKYRALKLPQGTRLKTVASFDNGDPAVLSKTFNKGELLILTSSWDAEDSQLALNSKFVILMNTVLKASTRFNEKKNQYLTGEKIKAKLSPAYTGAGIYTAGEGEDSYKIALNIPPSESKMKKLTGVDFKNAGAVIVDKKKMGAHLKARYEGSSILKNQQKDRTHLWRAMILAALLFICLESIMAHLTHKRMDSYEA